MTLQFSPTTKSLLFSAFGLSLLQIVIATAGFIFMQPEIPLFYSLPRLDQQLAPKIWIFLFPIMSLLVNGVHAVLIGLESQRESLLLVLFARITLILQIMLLLAVLRIVYITV